MTQDKQLPTTAAGQGLATTTGKRSSLVGRGLAAVQARKNHVLIPEKSDAELWCEVGKKYLTGDGVKPNDKRAAYWFFKAAEQHYAEAQNNLGEMYYFGRGAPEDHEEAVKWYRLAAEQGHVEAQYNLGTMYEYGLGITGDDAEAMKWYRLAAEQGNADAQSNLGKMYDNGREASQDDADAEMMRDNTSFKPDYGLRLLNDGISRKDDHYFYDFPLYSLTVLSKGEYSTMVEIPFDGKIYAMSLDFSQHHLDRILRKATQDISRDLNRELSKNPNTPRTIDFEGEIIFDVRARLGELQQVQKESFVPFVAEEIM